MMLDDFFAVGQPYARSRTVAAAFNSLKDAKNSVEMRWFDANSVVLYREPPLVLLSLDINANLQRVVAGKLDRVANEVLKQLDEQ